MSLLAASLSYGVVLRKLVSGTLKKRAPGTYQKLLGLFPSLSRSKILVTYPHQAKGTWSSRRLNFLAEGTPSFNRYLEIGIQSGNTLEAVSLPLRVGVDPEPLMNTYDLPSGMTVLPITSDEFFQSYTGPRFDLIFLDGLHEWFQTYKDVVNALNHLAKGGLILVDDVIPTDSISAMSSLEESYRRRDELGSSDRRWHGDVYKAILAIRDFHPEVSVRVIHDPQGNSQAILQMESGDGVGRHSVRAARDAYADISYEDVFVDGEPPPSFNAGVEAEVLSSFQRD